MSNPQKVIGVLVLLLVVVSSSYYYYQDKEKVDYEEGLRELDRINKLLEVNPNDLADPESQRVSQQAKDFVERENNRGVKW